MTHQLTEKEMAERDRKIITLHEEHGVEPKDIARRFGLRPPRVHQIIREYRKQADA